MCAARPQMTVTREASDDDRNHSAAAQALPDEEVVFWFSRDLQELLGYAPDDHFLGVTKMVRVGSGAERGEKVFSDA